MIKLFDLACMSTATTGTGTITFGAAVTPFLSFASAGATDGDVVSYGIIDGANSEVGRGTIGNSVTTMTRSPLRSTNSNNAISLSGSAQVYISSLAEDFRPTSNPYMAAGLPINCQLNASVGSSKLTVALKGNDGNDPSASNPVLLPFRDSTIANGGPVWVAVTGALSISTYAVGASLGTDDDSPFRLWVVAFNDGGTVKLALWQSQTGGASPTAVASLNDSVPASSTAISGSATAPATFYTPNGVAAVTSKSFCILGWLEYASGLTTAGTYASAPTKIHLFGPGSKKPGDVVQSVYNTYSTTASQGSGWAMTGLAVAIYMTSTPNVALTMASGSMELAADSTDLAAAVLCRGGTGGAFGNQAIAYASSTDVTQVPATNVGMDKPAALSQSGYGVAITGTGGTVSYPVTGAPASIVVQEIMV